MKRLTGLLGLTLALTLLSACGHAGAAPPPLAPPPPPPPPRPGGGPPWFVTCRVVDHYESGSLLLAENDGAAGAVYSLDAGALDPDIPIEDGQLINVYFDLIAESYPAQFSGVSKVELAEAETDDRCGLYLQVLEDLWVVDPGLNDGITELGVDLSGVADLTEAEKSAVAWRFGELHGIVPLEATYDGLVEEGYIDGEKLYWEDGCLFTLSGSAEEGFDAQKWCSGLGAYLFTGCTARRSGDGSWTYSIGAEAIS